MVCSVCGKEMEVVYDQKTDMSMAYCETCQIRMPYKKMEVDSNYNSIHKSKEKVEQNATTIRFCRIAACLCGALGLIGVFLPFVKISVWGFSQEATFYELCEDAIFLVGLFALGLFFAAVGKFIVPLFTGILVAVLLYIDISGYWDQLAAGSYGEFVNKGIGYYFLYIGAIGMCSLAIIGITAEISEYFQNRKKKNEQNTN